MEFKIQITPGAKDLFARLGADLDTGRRAGMITVLEGIRAKALPLVPKKTSNLLNSITTDVTGDGQRGTIFTDNTAKYAEFVHEGTGLFGPHKTRVVPKKAKALYIPGIGFRKSTKGMPGRPFFTQALGKVDPSKLYDEGIMNFMRKRGW